MKNKVHVYKYNKNYKFLIIINKSEFTLTLKLRNGKSVLALPKVYKIGIGHNPDMGRKIKVGDNRTPEGVYFVCQKEILKKGKLGTRWMRLTYPNISDINNGYKNGIISRKDYGALKNGYKNNLFKRIETPLGFGIGIHGTDEPQSVGTLCSSGCIRMLNSDIEELYDFVPVGTRVEIYR